MEGPTAQPSADRSATDRSAALRAVDRKSRGYAREMNSYCGPDGRMQESAQKNKTVASEQRMNPSRSLLVSLSLAIGIGICVPSAALAKEEMSRRTRKIHDPIPLNGATLQQARQAILLGMYYNKGVRLSYEGETANSVTARWDYRGGIVVFDVRYDEKQIQVLYRDASEGLECRELESGICHEGTSRYYNYMPNFTKSIRIQLARVGRAK